VLVAAITAAGDAHPHVGHESLVEFLQLAGRGVQQLLQLPFTALKDHHVPVATNLLHKTPFQVVTPEETGFVQLLGEGLHGQFLGRHVACARLRHHRACVGVHGKLLMVKPSITGQQLVCSEPYRVIVIGLCCNHFRRLVSAVLCYCLSRQCAPVSSG